MNRLMLLAFALMSLSTPIQAKTNQDQFEEERLDKKQIKMIQEEQAKPSSTPLGGSRSGQLEIEKKLDEEKLQHDLDKQKQLYEYEDNYRRGL